MRPLTSTALAIPFLFCSIVSAVTLECDHIRSDGRKFDLQKLGGPHSIVQFDGSRPPAVYNTTFTVDICKALPRDPKIDKANQCPIGTRVCGIKTFSNSADDSPIEVENVIPIAGNFEHDGRFLDPKWKRLKVLDSEKEGLQIELNGGLFAKKKQKAIIEFQCDKTRTGNEEYKPNSVVKRDDKDDKKDKPDDEEQDDRSLTLVSYGPEGDKAGLDILRLNWRTKYACEDYDKDKDDDEDDSGADKTAGWGFFTWFILILFLSIAAYLIFGSWLNYNRYGARGWDLLPHGDTIRDIPYLFKDWSRKVVGTVSGSGSRGGYSAV